AVGLIKIGLRELNRIDGANDFYHVPIQLLASGLERFMKCIICFHYLGTKGEFPARDVFPAGKKGHNLVWLLKKIAMDCFSDSYLSNIPAARDDIAFLRSDRQLREVVHILSDFGESARYYNLNIVLSDNNPGDSPERKWQQLELQIAKEDPGWAKELTDGKGISRTYQRVTSRVTAHCERLVRGLSRLFTIGGLVEEAKRNTSYVKDFLYLRDEDLGTKDYADAKL
ncbi:MAG: hypothetical protein Q8Q12_05045, partial [bacterium]|nr:hypothetical protein [bacterium]